MVTIYCNGCEVRVPDGGHVRVTMRAVGAASSEEVAPPHGKNKEDRVSEEKILSQRKKWREEEDIEEKIRAQGFVPPWKKRVKKGVK
ncbi:MAG: hypothetical protein Q4D38_01835 [Planctomycetia bacterium]|nr:hypothetical protein [Planctomycetia bacterium]